MPRTPIHPGEVLVDELEETGLTARKLAEVIEVPPNRLYQILAGKRNMTADTALRLAQYFGMPADFWTIRLRYLSFPELPGLGSGSPCLAQLSR